MCNLKIVFSMNFECLCFRVIPNLWWLLNVIEKKGQLTVNIQSNKYLFSALCDQNQCKISKWMKKKRCIHIQDTIYSLLSVKLSHMAKLVQESNIPQNFRRCFFWSAGFAIRKMCAVVTPMGWSWTVWPNLLLFTHLWMSHIDFSRGALLVNLWC